MGSRVIAFVLWQFGFESWLAGSIVESWLSAAVVGHFFS